MFTFIKISNSKNKNKNPCKIWGVIKKPTPQTPKTNSIFEI